MSDNLDTLSDRELNEDFALQSGWTRRGDNLMWWHPKEYPVGFIPDFCNDANAVLPFIEEHYGEYEYANASRFTARTGPAEWHMRLYLGNGCSIAKASTFARVCVIALLRARRTP